MQPNIAKIYNLTGDCTKFEGTSAIQDALSHIFAHIAPQAKIWGFQRSKGSYEITDQSDQLLGKLVLTYDVDTYKFKPEVIR